MKLIFKQKFSLLKKQHFTIFYTFTPFLSLCYKNDIFYARVCNYFSFPSRQTTNLIILSCIAITAIRVTIYGIFCNELWLVKTRDSGDKLVKQDRKTNKPSKRQSSRCISQINANLLTQYLILYRYLKNDCQHFLAMIKAVS